MLSQQTRRAGKRAPRRLEARVEARARSRASNGQACTVCNMYNIMFAVSQCNIYYFIYSIYTMQDLPWICYNGCV